MWQLVQRRSTDIARIILFARCIIYGYVRHGVLTPQEKQRARGTKISCQRWVTEVLYAEVR